MLTLENMFLLVSGWLVAFGKFPRKMFLQAQDMVTMSAGRAVPSFSILDVDSLYKKNLGPRQSY
jgi:hypothetical protein